MPLGVSFEPFAALACCESLPRHPPHPPSGLLEKRGEPAPTVGGLDSKLGIPPIT